MQVLTVLVTGANSGIGQAAVRAFTARGYRVIATMRDPVKAGELADLENVEIAQLDITKADDIERIVGAYPDIDVLVNNAGYGLIGAVEDCSEAQVRAQWETNVWGTMALIRAYLTRFRARGSGSIVTISSIGGRMVFPFFGYYNAGKHAVEALHEALWYELRDTDVRVRLVEPGFTQTGFASGMTRGDQGLPAYATATTALEEKMKAGTTGTPPAEIAKLIVKAATSTTTQLRYVGGRLAWPLLMLRRLLPDALFMRLIARQIPTSSSSSS